MKYQIYTVVNFGQGLLDLNENQLLLTEDMTRDESNFVKTTGTESGNPLKNTFQVDGTFAMQRAGVGFKIESEAMRLLTELPASPNNLDIASVGYVKDSNTILASMAHPYTITNTTTETLGGYAVLSPGKLNGEMAIDVSSVLIKSLNTQATTVKLYIKELANPTDTPTLSGATQIGTLANAAAQTSAPFQRFIIFTGGKLVTYSTTASLMSMLAAINATISRLDFIVNPAKAYAFMISVGDGSSSTEMLVSNLTIKRLN